MTDALTGSEIAVVGLACRFPGAADAGAFWRNLCEGVESITELDDDELETSGLEPGAAASPDYVKVAALLDDVDRFDAAFFGITPKEAEVMDPQQRLFLECAWQALEDAGYDSERYPAPVGVWAGARTNTYLLNLYSNRRSFAELGAFQIGLGNDLAFLTTRISHKLDLSGPSCSVHTACSTSLVAVHLACQSLLIDECDMALAGGVAVNVPQRTGYLYQRGGILSPDGHCRAFDARAAGTIFGSGVGIVVLRRLEDAERDGDRVLAVVKGSSINNDGSSKASFTAPSVRGQARVVAEALANAEIDPATVSYIETHGTATELGDAIEIRALRRAFGAEAGDGGRPCAIGSVKTNFGHLDAAAGVAGLIKAVLMLEHRQLVPSLHFERPNPRIELADGPFYVQTELADWESDGTPRRAGVSSFGVGGTNAHVVLEEASPRPPSGASRPCQLLPLSARSSAALERLRENLLVRLRDAGELPLADVAYTLAVGRRALGHRQAVVCRDLESAVAALEGGGRGLPGGFHEGPARPVCFLFPGQGAQHVDMGRELYRSETTFRREVDRCCELLEPHLGLDLREVLYPDPAALESAERRIGRTAITQSALFVVEYALARLWMSWGVRPAALVGHSIGEYVAACVAEVLPLADALALVAARGRLMDALDGGTMLAVSLAEEELLQLLDEPLSLAAVNAPALCVASGPEDAVAALEARLGEGSIACRRLRTSHAFHSAMMEPAIEPLVAEVERLRLRPPRIPYLSNVSGDWITDEEAVDPGYWGRHLRSTVRFSAGVRRLLDEGHRLLLEVGPGRALGQLARRHGAGDERPEVVSSLGGAAAAGRESERLLEALGRLWSAGAAVDWASFYAGERRYRVALPTYPFERQRFWIEARADEAETPVEAAAGKRSDVGDWFYRPAWRAAPSPAGDGSPRRWWILDDGDGLGPALADRLRSAGHEVATVRAAAAFECLDDGAFAVAPDDPEHYRRLLEALEAEERPPEAIVHLWSLAAGTGTLPGPERFRAAQRRGFDSLLLLTRALHRHAPSAAPDLWVVASGLHGVEDGELPEPEKAPLVGAAKVISQEVEALTCRTVDVVPPAAGGGDEAELVELLLAELAAAGPELEVAWRGSQRWVRGFEPLRLGDAEPPPRPLRERGVYLITGGLGGVGRLLAGYLARSVEARLVLTGRSPLPERGEWREWLESHGPEDPVSRKIEQVRELEAAGAEVLVLAADVADEAGMREVLEAVDARFGDLDGVLHAAGVTSGESVYKAVTELTPADAEEQFRPKVHGVYVLERLLRDRRPDFCLLFSSTAAVLGGIGYAAYCAANAFMDAFAAARRGERGTAWISANWDPWPEETKKYEGVQTSVDRYAMTEAEGTEAFRRLVCAADPGQVIVATGDLESRYDLWMRGRPPATAGSDATVSEPGSSQQRPEMSTAFVAPGNELEGKIAAIWQEVLGIREVGVDDNFFDLGGHSLLMITVQGKLNELVGAELPMVELFKNPTIRSLAASLAQEGLEEPLFEQIDRRAQRQAEAMARQRRARAAAADAASPAPAGGEPASAGRSAILATLDDVAGPEAADDLAPEAARDPAPEAPEPDHDFAGVAAGGEAAFADDELAAFGAALVDRMRETAESVVYYPHPFSRGGFVVVVREGVELLDCLVAAYADAPPDVMVYCLRRSELVELSYPGLFVPPDVNGKVHLPYWIRHKGSVLLGVDVRGEIEPPDVDPRLLLEGHLAGCALYLRNVVLGKLMEGKHLAMVRELDRQMRYLMATALLVERIWDVGIEELPGQFERAFGDGPPQRSFQRLTELRAELEAAPEAECRALAREAVWSMESFLRGLRRVAA